MATDVKGQLVVTDSQGSRTTQNYNNLNPDATDTQIGTALEALADLQTGSIAAIRKVVTTEIETSA